MKIAIEIIFSFTCSVGFGICFQIKPKELYLAGMAGAIVRIVLILASFFTPSRLISSFLGALAGTFFAEFLGYKMKTSIAKFMYPAMIPLIPGDVLYNLINSLINVDGEALGFGVTLTAALIGIALGCMIAPMIVHSKAYWSRALHR